MSGTTGDDYTERLSTLATKRWKILLDTQRPYRRQLHRMEPGRTLDIGCGIGRNLVNLSGDSVGVGHNAHSVEVVKGFGCTAYTADEFHGTDEAAPKRFDLLLFSHLIDEHLDPQADRALLDPYIPYRKVNEQLIIICPEEKGYASDATHVMMYDFDDFDDLALVEDAGFSVKKSS